MAVPPNTSGPSGMRWTWLLLVVAAAGLGRVAYVGLHRPAAPAAAGATATAQGEGPMGWVPAAAAEQQSKGTGKPILYEFNAAWCGPCQMLGREVFADGAKARAIASQVVPVSVVDRYREDGRNAPEVDALQQRFQVEAFPTLVVVSPSTGRFEKSEGYAGADATLEWIARASASVR